MKKLIILFAFALVGLTTVNAQDDKDFDYYNAPTWLWTMDYSMAFPSGDFSTFLDAPSFRGWHIEVRHFLLDNKISVGTGFSWNGFYKDFGRNTIEVEGGAITSNMFRYLYTTSLDFNAHYYIFDSEAFIQPYVGVQFGPHYFKRQSQIGSYYVEDISWNFTVAPQIGVYIPFGEDSEWGFHSSAQYNYAIYNRANFEGLSYLSVNCGFTYKY